MTFDADGGAAMDAPRVTGLLLGVDAGKSKTVCLLADRDGSILGSGRSGSGDKSVVSLGVAIDAVNAAVEAATRTASAHQDDRGIGCFGMAGADWPEDFTRLHDEIGQRRLARVVIIRNDAQIALRGASARGVGMVLSAGTHLSVALRTTARQEWFSGWSSVDGPGGAETGRRVMWAVLHAYDGRGDATALTGAVLDATGLTPEGLLRAVSTGAADAQFTARLAPLLFRTHAQTSDPVAEAIITDIGHEMARWVIGLSARYGLRGADADVFLAGGLFRDSGRLLREVLASAVHADSPSSRLVPAAHEPVLGALFECFDRAGIELTPAVLDRLSETTPPAAFFETA